MTPDQLRVLLGKTIPARVPVLIKGKPGIGKSDSVHQATADVGADLIISHPSTEDPTDSKGMPFASNGVADFLPFGQLRKARAARKLTVWFVDDLGQASPAVQAAYMPLLDSVRGHNDLLGDAKDHIVFVGATNDRSHRANVSGILEPVKSRFASIVELEPDLASWCSWALSHNIPPVVIAYLRFKPDHLCQFSATADLTNSPSPRTWAAVARILSLDLPADLQHAAIVGAIGEATAIEFAAFLRMYAQLPSIDQILIDPSSVPIPNEPSVLYAISSALAHRSSPSNFARVSQFMQRMIDDGHGEFAIYIFKDAQKKHPDIVPTAAYIRLVSNPDFAQLVA